jgi:hypothetical protein
MPKSTERVVTLNREKETPNKVRFKEEAVEGQPPVLDTLYVPKWLAGDAASVQVTVKIL